MSKAPEIAPREWRWVIIVAVVVLLLSSIPYVIATVAAPSNWHFAGFLFNPLDGHSYLAKMAQGEADHWRFVLNYTPEAHDGAYIFSFYLLLGHLARVTGLAKIFLFHLARIVAGLLLLLMSYRFVARVTIIRTERQLAFIFLGTTMGLGWLGVAFNTFPIDLAVPEAFVPLSIYTNPHFPLGMALMLAIFDQFLAARRTLPAVAGTSVAALALATVLPFGLLTVWAVIVVFQVWIFLSDGRRLSMSRLWLTLGIVAASAPIVGYQYWVSISNPAMAGWSAQNITVAPSLIDFALGYGITGLLALLGIWIVIRHQPTSDGEWLLVVWVVTTVALTYFPLFNLQRRLISGLHIPVCILAAIGLLRWLEARQLKIGYRRLVAYTAVGLGAIGTLFVWSVPLIGALQSPETSGATAMLFIREDEQAAFNWLAQNTQPDNVILASERVGMFVPGQTGARAYYGHPFETIEAKKKVAQLEAFFRGEIKTVSPPADFVIYGPSEQALGQLQLSDRSIVFKAGDVTVFRP